MICSLAIARIVNSQFKSFYLTLHLSHLAVHIRQAVEDCAGTHKRLCVDSRSTSQGCRFFYIADHAALCTEYHMVRHMDMSG